MAFDWARLRLRSFANQRPVVLVWMVALAIVGFLGVSRLVHRFGEQEKALARHLYAQGQLAQSAKQQDRAIEDYRAALQYDRDNFQYRFSLAAALRDSGRTDESENYFLRLWEANPQDGMVNRALGRLAARQGRVDKAIQYYHNAIYGVWAEDAQNNRLNSQLELIRFLIRAGEQPQAQAELIMLSSANLSGVSMRLQLAQLFFDASDLAHSLVEFETVYRQLDHSTHANERKPGDINDLAQAAAGAGSAAFGLNQFQRAQFYLREAVRLKPSDTVSENLLKETNLIFALDPFQRGLSPRERTQRMETAFERSGDRLASCSASLAGKSPSNTESGASPLDDLKKRWLELKPRMSPGRGSSEDSRLAAVDLSFDIEAETAKLCGQPNGDDRALLLIAQSRGTPESSPLP